MSSILELKCNNKDCWHYSIKGQPYCIHCTYGQCTTLSIDEEIQYRIEELDQMIKELV